MVLPNSSYRIPEKQLKMAVVRLFCHLFRCGKMWPKSASAGENQNEKDKTVTYCPTVTEVSHRTHRRRNPVALWSPPTPPISSLAALNSAVAGTIFRLNFPPAPEFPMWYVSFCAIIFSLDAGMKDLETLRVYLCGLSYLVLIAF